MQVFSKLWHDILATKVIEFSRNPRKYCASFEAKYSPAKKVGRSGRAATAAQLQAASKAASKRPGPARPSCMVTHSYERPRFRLAALKALRSTTRHKKRTAVFFCLKEDSKYHALRLVPNLV